MVCPLRTVSTSAVLPTYHIQGAVDSISFGPLWTDSLHGSIASGDEAMRYLHLVRCKGEGSGSRKRHRAAMKPVVDFEDGLLTPLCT
mmetsp:Transcript_3971/g.25009  ORF Transcript_3971/g.25009 Transcript_3971/m.25009 type:complete len:87 (-) Transcript_3971:271-531(-)